MKKGFTIILAMIWFLSCLTATGCNNSNEENSKDKGTVHFNISEKTVRTVEYNNSLDITDLKYNNDFSECNRDTQYISQRYIRYIGDLPLKTESNEICVRQYKGRLYTVQKIKFNNNSDVYGFEFYDEAGCLRCIYAVEKIFPYIASDYIVGKTTVNDLKKTFPYEDYNGIEINDENQNDDSGLVFNLQFLDGEYQFGFEKKGKNYVLDHVQKIIEKKDQPTPFLISENILPKDLEVITK